MVQDIGDLVILQIAQRGHDGVVGTSSDLNGAGHAVEDDSDQVASPAGLEQANRMSGERWRQGGQRPAIRGVTTGAQPGVDLLSALGLKHLRRKGAAGDDAAGSDEKESSHFIESKSAAPLYSWGLGEGAGDAGFSSGKSGRRDQSSKEPS